MRRLTKDTNRAMDTLTHDHKTPVFGCEECIKNARSQENSLASRFDHLVGKLAQLSIALGTVIDEFEDLRCEIDDG